MSKKQPNIVFFFWDNLGWGEVGCYGGGMLRGAPTPRIDELAADGLKLLNFNVEAQCTPSRSALLTGRHPIRSGTQTVPITGGPDGLTRWEVTTAQALSDAGYATGMWGKWHLGSDPEQRSPVDFGFDEAVWSPRTADEVLWTMQSYFPDGDGHGHPVCRATPRSRWSRSRSTRARRARSAEVDRHLRRGVPRRVRPQDHRLGDRLHDPVQRRPASRSTCTCPTPRCTSRRSRTRSTRARPSAATSRTCWPRWTTSPARSWTRWTSSGWPTTRSWCGRPTTAPTPTTVSRPVTPTRSAGSGRAAPGRGGGGLLHLARRARTGRRASSAGRARSRPARSATSWCTRWTGSRPCCMPAGAKVPTDRQIDGMDMRDFLLGDAEESGRDTVLCIQGNRLQAVEVAAVEGAPVPAGRHVLDLVAVQRAARAQPRMGSARGAPGRLPAPWVSIRWRPRRARS